MPRAAAGLEVSAFARELDRPRWLYVLPNGDVLVAETGASARERALEHERGRAAILVASSSVALAAGRPQGEARDTIWRVTAR